MVKLTQALAFSLVLVATAGAQPAESLFVEKQALVEEAGGLDRGELGRLLPPEPDALGCGAPCQSGTLSATHPFYDVYVNCADGSFTARTGASHSVTIGSGVPQNVIYGGAGGFGSTTSDIAFHVHETGRTYIDPTGGAACGFDPPDTATEPASVGLEQEWQVVDAPGRELTFRQEVVAFGDTESNSGIRLTLGVTNNPGSTLPATIGLRWQIDYQNAGDDGPLFTALTCDPPVLDAELATEHDFLPSEIKDFYRIRNNAGTPIFSNVTSTTPLGGIPNTDRPDRLVYGTWGSLLNSAWTYAANEGSGGPDLDSAVLYYFGYQPADAFQLAPGESVTRSVVIFTSSAGVDCGDFVPSCASSVTNPPVDRSICEGERTTLDASGIGLSNCEGSVEYEWSDPFGPIADTASVEVAPSETTRYDYLLTCSTDVDCTYEDSVLVEVELPPQLGAGLAFDLDECNDGLMLEWDPAEFRNELGGTYNVYRSTVSCADALLSPPLVTGLTNETWLDVGAISGETYIYVVEAEDALPSSACSPQGPNNAGAVARLCLSPVLDRGPNLRPPGVGAVLFLSHEGQRVDFDWSSSRPLVDAEHFHLLKARDSAEEGFFHANGENAIGSGWSETDPSSALQFFDLRVADLCETLSLDEFPPSR